MIEPEALKYGQTPFDDMTREELLEEVKTQFSAIMRADGVLHTLSYNQIDHPYWQPGGSGWQAQSKVDDIVKRVNQNRTDGCEAISRAYFRYSDQIHFPHLAQGRDIWWINDDGQMLSGGANGERPSNMFDWNNNWRRFTVDDLKPLEEEVEND